MYLKLIKWLKIAVWLSSIYFNYWLARDTIIYLVGLSVSMKEFFGIPEKNNELTGFEKKVFDLVVEHWPISALELAEHFKEHGSSREEKKRLSTKYSYYLKKLAHKRMILGKRVGNSFIAWPLVVEKYRTIHHILKE